MDRKEVLEKISNLSYEKKALLSKLLAQQQAKSGIGLSLSSEKNRNELNYFQHQLFFLDQLSSNKAIYNLTGGISITGKIDTEILQSAIQNIINRHEVLRTGFVEENGKPAQFIKNNVEFHLNCSEIPDGSIGEYDLKISAHIEKMRMEPFDLSCAPLLRAHFIKLNDTAGTLIISLHHIISDAWSIYLFLQELITFYNSILSKEESPLKALPIQYSDYTNWLNEWMKTNDFNKKTGYWKEKLSGAPPLMSFHTDFPRPVVKSFNGGSLTFIIPDSIVKGIRELSGKKEMSLFMILLTAFKILLYRYTGQNDIVIGTPVANRMFNCSEELLGLFINTVALRSMLNDDITLQDLLENIRTTSLQAYDNQDVPFSKVVEALEIERDPSYMPVFELLFSFQSIPVKIPGSPGFQFTFLKPSSVSSKYDLSLIIEENENGMECMLEYATDLFKRETITTIFNHYLCILEQIPGSLTKKIAEIQLISAFERASLLNSLNKTKTPFPSHLCIHNLFEEQAKKHPHRMAIKYGDLDLSYEELDKQSNKLASYLAQKVKPGFVVGLFMERSPEMVIAIMGIVRSGACYMPLEPGMPVKRLNYLLTNSGLDLVLIHDKTRDEAALLNITVVDVYDILKAPERSGVINFHSMVTPDDPAYVIYTSGSTGNPKGVVVPHKGLVNRICWMQNRMPLDHTDKVLQKTPFTFDVSVWEFFWPLAYGATLVIAKPGGHQDPDYLRKVIEEEKITTIHFVPSMLNAFLKNPDLKLGRHLRRVICSGEALSVETVREFRKRSDAAMYNLYGPTEASIDVTCYQIDEGDENAGYIPIGKPIDNTGIYILDKDRHMVPAGIPGEICIAGVGLALGYLNNEELTNEKFIEYANEDGNGPIRLYCTGDLGCYNTDGNIRYLGRNDSQVKLRGYRIELSEIEAVIKRYKPGTEAICLYHKGDQGNLAYLVAYAVVPAGSNDVENEILAFLREHLPVYMVPSRLHILDSLPLNSNGKVDNHALRTIDAKLSAKNATAEPLTETEQMLVTVWKEVLLIDNVGADDNFFSLGGDSIRSIEVKFKVQKFGYYLTLQDTFKFQTIRTLATRVTPFKATDDIRQHHIPVEAEKEFMKERNAVDIYPLSQLQQGMIFHNEIDESSFSYHDIITVHLTNLQFNKEYFHSSLQRMFERHPVLRTSFDLGRFPYPVQLVHANVDISMQVLDVSGLPVTEQNRKVKESFEQEKNTRFDIKTPGLIRVIIHKRGSQEFQFTLSFHHAILDGWSLSIFLTELFREYLDRIDGKHSNFDDVLACQFRDYIMLEKEALSSDGSRVFWQEKLRSAAAGTLFLKNGSKNDHGIKTIEVPVSDVLSQALKETSSRLGMPLRTILLAVHVRVLAFISGSNDVVTGVVSNGRPEVADGEKCLGLFLNTLPFPVTNVWQEWPDLIRSIFDNELEMILHRRYPLAAMLVDSGRDSLFEAVFNFMHFHAYGELIQSKRLIATAFDSFEQTNFPLLTNFNRDPRTDKVTLNLSVDLSKITAEKAERIAGYYLAAMQSLAFNHSVKDTRETDYLGDTELQLLKSFGKGPEKNIWEHVIDPFLDQVKKCPAAVAVKDKGLTFTYRELYNRALVISEKLINYGVVPGERVGFMIERSFDMIAAITGILLVKGVYVPLDTSLPAERLSYIISDAELKFILAAEKLPVYLNEDQQKITVIEINGAEVTGNKNQFIYDREQYRTGDQENDVIYLLYTSGSTGVPKGVSVHNKILSNLIQWQLNTPIASEDKCVCLQYTPIGFDVSFQEIFFTLSAGGQLVLIGDDERKDMGTLLKCLIENKVTHLFMPPVALYFLSGHCNHENLFPEALKHLICAGEALKITPDVRRFFKNLPHCRLHNHYGPTETHVVTSFSFSADAEQWPDIPPIGKPIYNIEIQILDSNRRKVPIGSAGLLFIGGLLVRPGYNQEAGDLQNKFSIYRGEDGAPFYLYNTGDLVRYSETGDIEYLGRNDTQVKIRGHRIELEEVEICLQKNPSVRLAVAYIDNLKNGNPSLGVCFIAEKGAEPVYHELRSFMADKLPEYMIPARFIQVDNFLFTSTGKIDRTAIANIAGKTLSQETNYVAPKTREEGALEKICAELLHSDKIGIHDNLIHLGVHSLLATQLIARANNLLKLNITIRDFYQHPTIEGLLKSSAGKTAIQDELQLTKIDNGGDSIEDILDLLNEQ